jgi:hypothetical protein
MLVTEMISVKLSIVAALPVCEFGTLPVLYRYCAECGRDTTVVVLTEEVSDSQWVLARNEPVLPAAFTARVRYWMQTLQQNANVAIPSCGDVECLAARFDW